MESMDNIRQNLKKAAEGDKDAIAKAEKEYRKAIAYDKEKEMIEGVKSRASSTFKELEKELVKLKSKE